MPVRVADERIGYFTAERLDFSSDSPRVPVQRFVTRWRLEKKDPSAALSEPKQPIVYWLDRNIPEKYRAADPRGHPRVEQGVRAHRLQGRDPRRGAGRRRRLRHQRHAPRVGALADGRAHVVRRDRPVGDRSAHRRDPRRRHRHRREQRPRRAQPQGRVRPAHSAEQRRSAGRAAVARPARCFAPTTTSRPARRSSACRCSRRAATSTRTAPTSSASSPRSSRTSVMHEVGHTLGLRHNFRASTIYTEAQLADPSSRASHGISGSVMEYNPWNLALRGAQQGEYQMSTLGPYDYWAIEYGYREIDAAEDEARELAIDREPQPRAGSRVRDRRGRELPLAGSADQHARPRRASRSRTRRSASRSCASCGSAPKAARSRTATAIRCCAGTSRAACPKPAQGAIYAAKYIGGLTTLRDRAGSGRDPLTPVPVDKQREALQLIATQVFSADSFRFSPAFLRRMSVSAFDIDDADRARPLGAECRHRGRPAGAGDAARRCSRNCSAKRSRSAW